MEENGQIDLCKIL